MKTLKILITVLIFSTLLACEGNDEIIQDASTLKIINFIKGEDNILVKTDDISIRYARTKSKVKFDQEKNFTVLANVERLIEVTKASDTLNPIYSETLNFSPGVYSLYFHGDVETPEYVLLEDKLKTLTDSVVKIRFLNLSERTKKMNVKSDSGDFIASNLEFKEVSEYIEFPLLATSFTFEDETGKSLKVYPFDPLDEKDISVKKHLTLVLIIKNSSFGGYNSIKRVNNY